MKLYRGKRNHDGGLLVEVIQPQDNGIEAVYELTPAESLKITNHSPTGFEIGYAGSGPAQLSLAIILDFFGESHPAMNEYQDFKFKYVALFDKDHFTLTEKQIQHWWRVRQKEVRSSPAVYE